MRHHILALCILSMAGCQAVQTGPDPQAGHGLRAITHVSGDFDGQVLNETYPLTALVKGHGEATLTGRPFPPFLTIDGNWNVIVEPAPGHEQEAITAQARGDILIRRNGIPGALNAPGAIAGYKAGIQRAWMPRPESPAAPKADPLPTVPPPSKQSAAMPAYEFEPDPSPECKDGTCHLPRSR